MQYMVIYDACNTLKQVYLQNIPKANLQSLHILNKYDIQYNPKSI